MGLHVGRLEGDDAAVGPLEGRILLVGFRDGSRVEGRTVLGFIVGDVG